MNEGIRIYFPGMDIKKTKVGSGETFTTPEVPVGDFGTAHLYGSSQADLMDEELGIFIAGEHILIEEANKLARSGLFCLSLVLEKTRPEVLLYCQMVTPHPDLILEGEVSFYDPDLDEEDPDKKYAAAADWWNRPDELSQDYRFFTRLDPDFFSELLFSFRFTGTI